MYNNLIIQLTFNDLDQFRFILSWIPSLSLSLFHSLVTQYLYLKYIFLLALIAIVIDIPYQQYFRKYYMSQ